MIFTVDDEVVSLTYIIEPRPNGVAVYDPVAKKCEAGWCHAAPGSLGRVIHVTKDGYPTVLFYGPATSTLCLPGEVERNGHRVSVNGSP